MNDVATNHYDWHEPRRPARGARPDVGRLHGRAAVRGLHRRHLSRCRRVPAERRRALHEQAQPVRPHGRHPVAPGPPGQDQAVHRPGGGPQLAARARFRVDQPGPVQRHARRRVRSGPGHPETPCPYSSTVDDPNDAALKAKADAFVQQAVETITSSKAWTGNSAIFILTDEADSTARLHRPDLWADVSGCCDSPGYGSAPALPSGYESSSTTGPAILVGPASSAAASPGIVSPATGARACSTGPLQPLLAASNDRAGWGLGYLGYAADRANVELHGRMLQH